MSLLGSALARGVQDEQGPDRWEREARADWQEERFLAHAQQSALTSALVLGQQ